MNDSLTSGARAKASWTIEANDAYTYDGVHMFTLDHQVKIFRVHGFADEAPEITEQPACPGPFAPGPTVCSYFYSSPPESIVGLAASGCP